MAAALIELDDASRWTFTERKILLEIVETVLILAVTGEVHLFEKGAERLVFVFRHDKAVQEISARRNESY